jgi:hypothetical protein
LVRVYWVECGVGGESSPVNVDWSWKTDTVLGKLFYRVRGTSRLLTIDFNAYVQEICASQLPRTRRQSWPMCPKPISEAFRHFPR